MVETILLKEIRKVLSQFSNYWDGETLLKNRVTDDLRNYKSELITALLLNQKIKEQFEVIIGDTTIFKIEEFIQQLTYKDFWEDSYTKYSNKIGLTANGKYLDYNSDVILDFPFKDCVLEGGMTKEEVRKKEVYYNKIIARDEVDTLLSPKVFTNIKKYTQDGEESVSKITDTDNLIIKGNNLLALHSLREKYVGKVKCIYIDPPYNTGEDSFKYNDRFNHSTWLTFMKNRLEVAKELLTDTGVIFVHCDDSEQAYLKVLMDEIFGKPNFIANFIWEKRTNRENRKMISSRHEYILCYAKNVNLNSKVIKQLKMTEKALLSYKNPDNDIRGLWKSDPATAQAGHGTPNQFYDLVSPNGKLHKLPSGRCWLYTQTTMQEAINDNRIWFGKDGNGVPRVKTYLHAKERGLTVETIWFAEDVSTSESAKNSLKLLFNGEALFLTPKPENLIQRILEISTNENDVVLDFFMGSATTQAVAMKMNRQFIGVEQMDYINTVSVPRLQKVMDGEQGGISKDVNWQGGSSFIYTELMDLNSTYITQIEEADNSSDLLKILETVKKYADLNYLVELEKLTNEPIVIDENTKETLSFEELSIEKQRELLIDIMDINQLYVNYSEIDDSSYHVSEQDKAFNRSFYEAGDN